MTEHTIIEDTELQNWLHETDDSKVDAICVNDCLEPLTLEEVI